MLKTEYKYIPINEAMYKHFIDVISKEDPGRYEIIVTEEERRIIRDCHCDEPTDIAYRYVNPKPVWGIGYSVRQDFFEKCFPDLHIPERFFSEK